MENTNVYGQAQEKYSRFIESIERLGHLLCAAVVERTDGDNDMLEKGQMIFWEGIDGLVDSVIVEGKKVFAVKSGQSFVVNRSAGTKGAGRTASGRSRPHERKAKLTPTRIEHLAGANEKILVDFDSDLCRQRERRVFLWSRGNLLRVGENRYRY